MASAMRLVALMRDAMISALIAGDQRVLIGSPARFTTPSHPEMAAGHRDGSAKAMVPLEKLPRNAARAFSTSRVSTTTSLPPASSFATRRVPTNPLAPEIATRIFPEEEEGLMGLMECVAGFGLGGSSIAMFGRVGGGICARAGTEAVPRRRSYSAIPERRAAATREQGVITSCSPSE